MSDVANEHKTWSTKKATKPAKRIQMHERVVQADNQVREIVNSFGLDVQTLHTDEAWKISYK